MLEQYRHDLEAELRRQKFKREFERIKAAHLIFRKYPTIEDIVALVQPGNKNYEDKDSVLKILVGELKRETTLFPLLNLTLWDGLVRLFRRKCWSVPNPEELFLQIQEDFFRTAVSYPLDRRPMKIDVNLILDTLKKVTAWQREEAMYSERHEELDLDHETQPKFSEFIRSEVFPEEMEVYLLDFVYRKVISQWQYDLLLETRVYKRMSQIEWAETRGVAYGTVRSWNFRAEMAIRKHWKARRQESDDL